MQACSGEGEDVRLPVGPGGRRTLQWRWQRCRRYLSDGYDPFGGYDCSDGFSGGDGGDGSVDGNNSDFVNYGSTPILLAAPSILLIIGSGNSGSPSDDPFQWRRGTSGGGGGSFGDS
ncbi:hypothetical protein GUJ93_ZPchr0006g41169 [Zizania palustris]|uniref:Uncharacterized protein n=1 Tax=Zizania palustris TaxID=103762 RepID=A0A8J5SSI8_ZIZPA|nr:hypothetical protein GUJ93_ZPchr0006g41169 [Zizania palustris]